MVRPLPTARWGLGVAAGPNGKLYAIGGGVGTAMESSTVEEYDPTTDTWAVRAGLLRPKFGAAAVGAPNGRIYVVGGFGTGADTQELQEYDPLTDALVLRAPMPWHIESLALAPSVRQGFLALGGCMCSGSTALKFVYEYVPETNRWVERQPMPTARDSAGAALGPDGRLYVIGGHDYYNPSAGARVEALRFATHEVAFPLALRGYLAPR
jgi:hypothetical protein